MELAVVLDSRPFPFIALYLCRHAIWQEDLCFEHSAGGGLLFANSVSYWGLQPGIAPVCTGASWIGQQGSEKVRKVRVDRALVQSQSGKASMQSQPEGCGEGVVLS